MVLEHYFNPAQKEFLGRVDGRMIRLAKFNEFVSVGETFQWRVRVDWRFNPKSCMPCDIKLHKPGHIKHLPFLVYTQGRVRYTPLYSRDLKAINPELEGVREYEQASELIQQGFNLCKLVLEGLTNGGVEDYKHDFLSGAVWHEEVMSVLRQNSERVVTLDEESVQQSRENYFYDVKELDV